MNAQLLSDLLTDGQILETQGRLVITEARITGLPHDFILLVEGHISEDTLNQYLSSVYGYPIPPESSPIPDENAIEVLDLETIRELGALPYRIFPEENKLQVLVAPPPAANRNEMQEHLSNILGFEVEIFIVSTLRFQYDLAICYMASDLPNIHLYAQGRLNGVGKEDDRRHMSPVMAEDQGDEAHDLHLPALRLLPVEGELTLPSEALYQTYELLTEMLVEKVAKPVEELHSLRKENIHLEPISIEELDSAFERVNTKDEFAEVFERFASGTFRTFALFMCLDGLIVGWRAFGGDLSAYDVYGIMLPDDRSSFLATIYQEDFFLGKPESTVANRRLMAILDAQKEDVILGASIKVGDRTILLAAGVPSNPKTASERAPQLYDACSKAGDTLKRLMKNRNKKN